MTVLQVCTGLTKLFYVYAPVKITHIKFGILFWLLQLVDDRNSQTKLSTNRGNAKNCPSFITVTFVA